MTTAALEPTWTTTSFFPKTTPLLRLGRRKPNKMTPVQCVTTTANRATTRKTWVATPIKTRKVVRHPKVEASQASKKMVRTAVVVVVVADVATTET